ncbi:hypothetical protein PG984_016301 [Apiospora sp. TS-2023a]
MRLYGNPAGKLVINGNCFTVQHSSVYYRHRFIVFHRRIYDGLYWWKRNCQHCDFIPKQHVGFGDIKLWICTCDCLNRKSILGRDIGYSNVSNN